MPVKTNKVSAKSGKVIKPQHIKGVNKFFVDARNKALAHANGLLGIKYLNDTKTHAVITGKHVKVIKGYREYTKTIKVPIKGEKKKFDSIQINRRVATFAMAPANLPRFIQPRRFPQVQSKR